MHPIVLFTFILSCLMLSACDNVNQPDSDFLERANIFWDDAVSNKCSKAKNMVRYPVLMDGISISDEEKLFDRCDAISTSVKFLENKMGVSSDDRSGFIIHESGWLKEEILAGHPLLKTHTGNDVSFFLLEVVSNESVEQPVTFIFRRDYEDKNGDWDIVMLEDYSLTKMMRNK